jgi:glutathione S-transferase
MSLVGGAASTILMPAVHSILNEPSQIFFFRTRGPKETNPPREMVEDHWKKFEVEFRVIDGWLKRTGESQKFIAGDALSYVDIELAARVMFIKKVLDVDGSDRWKRVQGWHGEQWAKLVANFQQYE